MIAYLDTSALLRLILGEPGGIKEVRGCEALVSSELLAVESLRTIDRLRLQGALSTKEAASRRNTVTEWLEVIDLVLLQRPILAEPRIRFRCRSARPTRCISRRHSYGVTAPDSRSSWPRTTMVSPSPHALSGSKSSGPEWSARSFGK